jgi:2-polyprenyl-6-methoxyphenol hydroxylase-like FAD-dependent oxidoreductase
MDPSPHDSRSVLISGGGIAGLTLATLLKERGWEPLVIEREPAVAAEGYMMDFYGTGWDVAERMDLVGALRAVRYPIDVMRYVDARGRPFLTLPLDVVRRTLDDRYAYLRRSDLERILFERARAAGVAVRFGTSVRCLKAEGDRPAVAFDGGGEAAFSLVVGADGVHSRVRELAFGPEASFARYLGYYVAAFGLPLAPEIGRSFTLYEEPDRVAGLYALSEGRMEATYIFRSEDVGPVPPAERLPLLRRRYAGAGWIAERVLGDLPPGAPIFLDSLTQIVMPRWSAGRVGLVGDACGCLTLAAGQGSHMAMAGAYVLATELARRPDPARALEAYERFLKPLVARKQRQAVQLAAQLVPTARSREWLRRLALRVMFGRPFIRWTFRGLGARSVLRQYVTSD